MAAPLKLTRTHRILAGVVIAGAVVIAGIGFAGSYAAVRELAIQKGFGNFSYVFPIGIDAGICVLLALDLLLTWIRIPFPLLRQTAWLLTAATIAFNGAAAWPDPLGVGMHAVIPILFVVSVEAARHAIGRIADITADKHMEGVRITRWLLSPLPTFLLWRRMKLWELRSYEAVIKLEQERLVYQARLRSRFGRAWRRKAPVESLMPLRLARYGVPLAETAPAGLAAAGIEPQLLPPAPRAATAELEASAPQERMQEQAQEQEQAQQPEPQQQSRPEPAPQHPQQPQQPEQAQPGPQQHPEAPGADPEADAQASQWFAQQRAVEYHGGYDPDFVPPAAPVHGPEPRPVQEEAPQQLLVPHPRAAEPEPSAPAEPEPEFPVPNGAGGTRQLGDGAAQPSAPSDEDLYQVFRYSIQGEGMPTPGAFQANVEATYGSRLSQRDLARYHEMFSKRLNAEFVDDHIA
ncbi:MULTISPECIES: DUF2637 domain-containing protein [unclassified Streptomyces]|uniref:DUF2637 domain-containing protein n=1 Tax=unclassified Streptomyces TaxID=2593676 RepID=UPI000DB93F06|nr:DUF2637 domain-containing protein [Streptomyces sp. PsTaAH-137]MYT72075.1 DUF2637 domain-containing protein [Streptomyces sp. SID8367]RAJ81486.1 uncharacterized protein DUF2637 [Streptomyces sp. PsTaAH-137]